ncbi:hypothetical protein F511_27835 [Dorcoceras hygrometricum]|uniref:Uncharacterized protein n=1 Tax=Dorcoceras hygrometricum TaxID=472368 RepID=A0A2Z7C5J3_9LAMI|nr:hypothetical protein F511_27835 [Dorcoceras hygrometricum]
MQLTNQTQLTLLGQIKLTVQLRSQADTSLYIQLRMPPLTACLQQQHRSPELSTGYHTVPPAAHITSVATTHSIRPLHAPVSSRRATTSRTQRSPNLQLVHNLVHNKTARYKTSDQLVQHTSSPPTRATALDSLFADLSIGHKVVAVEKSSYKVVLCVVCHLMLLQALCLFRISDSVFHWTEIPMMN